MTTSTRPPPPTLEWQAPKHLASRDCFWILTDIQAFTDCYLAWSPPQQLFRVGIYDLTTEKIGLATFGRDIAYAILKAGITPPPWTSPAPFSHYTDARRPRGRSKGPIRHHRFPRPDRLGSVEHHPRGAPEVRDPTPHECFTGDVAGPRDPSAQGERDRGGRARNGRSVLGR